MNEQTRLFRLALDAVAIDAHYEPAEGWSLNVRARRGDETWQEGHHSTYRPLTSSELVDVIVAELETIFGF